MEGAEGDTQNNRTTIKYGVVVYIVSQLLKLDAHEKVPEKPVALSGLFRIKEQAAEIQSVLEIIEAFSINLRCRGSLKGSPKCAKRSRKADMPNLGWLSRTGRGLSDENSVCSDSPRRHHSALRFSLGVRPEKFHPRSAFEKKHCAGMSVRPNVPWPTPRQIAHSPLWATEASCEFLKYLAPPAQALGGLGDGIVSQGLTISQRLHCAR